MSTAGSSRPAQMQSEKSAAGVEARTGPSLSSLNHVSFLCADVDRTKRFYRDLLGFVEVKRPDSFKFEGSWLFGHGGIAIHLISGNPPLKPRPLNPQDVHISFLSPDLDAIEAHLGNHHVPTVRATVFEAGTKVTQEKADLSNPMKATSVFCHDPDHNMLEFCNCNCLPVLPLSSLHGTMGISLPDPGDDLGCRDRMSTDSHTLSTDVVNISCHSTGSGSLSD